MRFRDKFIRFMYGRYGADELYRFLTWTFLLLWAFNLFLNSIIIYTVMLGVMLWQLMRVFSKNIPARRKENAVYLKIKGKVGGFFKNIWMRIKDIRTFRYRKCPKCSATLRLPRKKGKHTTRCPRCGNEFEVKITL